jgi:2-dehydro-3-deoxy-D-arabinonate dehydratase
MRYYRVADGCESRLIAETADDAYDLSSARSEITGFVDLARIASVMDRSIDSITDSLISDAPSTDPVSSSHRPQSPIVAEEVWAAGVTYRISEAARKSESGNPDVYQQIYNNERPEIFFKASPSRTVGPGEDVGIRSDSTWDVPEPELALVIYDGDIVGFTIGNDMSSRSIEGENPLYLPQAKVYDRCCAVGPCIATPATVGDPHNLDVEMAISRDGETIFEGDTTTAEMIKTCDDLVSHLGKSNQVPKTTVLLTGTALVPNDDFTLRPDDRIDISIEDIGVLTNTVREV